MRLTQTFEGGIRQDIDPHRQPTGTYRQLTNGRLIFQGGDGDPSLGKGGSIVNLPGNKTALVLPFYHQFVDATETRLGNLIVSVSGVNCQLGLWTFDGADGTPGTYELLYDDRFDPHVPGVTHRRRGAGEAAHMRLPITVDDELDFEVTYLNEFTERVILTTRRHAPLVINVRKPGTVQADGYYSSDWSVHGFAQRPAVVPPLVKPLGRCPGRLPAGAYQIAAYYESADGSVRSAVSPLLRRLFVTENPMDDAEPLRQTALRANHHNRTMGAAGPLTREGLRVELRGVDLRWPVLRPVVIYYATQGLPSRIVALEPIATNLAAPDESAFGNTLPVSITDLRGQELSIAELNLTHQVLERVQTLKSENDRLVLAGLRRAPSLFMDVSGVRYAPLTKLMGADSMGNGTFTAVSNPATGRLDGDPLTNTFPVASAVINRRLFGEQVEAFSVTDDYLNDKGQVWDYLHNSYWREETYEPGAVLLDKLGQPLFVQPAAAYTFPGQYDTDADGKLAYTLTDTMPGFVFPQPRLLGLKVSGLALPVADLFDEQGELRVSGFLIATRARKKKVLHQGIVVPVTRTDYCDTADGSDYRQFPLPVGNLFETAAGLPGRYEYFYQTPCKGASEHFNRTFSQPGHLTYHSPDLLIEGAFRPLQTGDVLRHVGVVSQSSSATIVPLAPPILTFKTHQYAKSYATQPFPRLTELARNGRPALGDTSRVSMALQLLSGYVHQYKDHDKDELNNVFDSSANPNLATGAQSVLTPLFVHGLISRGAVLMRADDWNAVDAAPAVDPLNPKPSDLPTSFAFRLANFEQIAPIPAKATDEAAAVDDPYLAGTHFQPLTKRWLEKAAVRRNAAGEITHYIFDDIELYDGDAKVQFMDHLRIYPYASDTCSKNDYSVGHILPIETNYNLMLRPGRSFARNGVRPEVASCEGTLPQTARGVMPPQPEDWNYNRVLQVTTALRPYNPLPPQTQLLTNEPADFVFTPRLLASARLDNWRQLFLNDNGRLDGRLGQIMQLVRADGSGLICYQQAGACLIPLDVAQFQAGADGLVQTDSGAVFRKEIPLSRTYGTQHPKSVWQLGGRVGAWDARRGVLHQLAGGIDPLSEREGIDDSIKAVSAPLATAPFGVPGYSCRAGVDPQTGEVLITITSPGDEAQTWIYQPRLGAFTGRYDVNAQRYFARGATLASVGIDRSALCRHNQGDPGEWYGQTFPTVLTLIVAPGREMTYDMMALSVPPAVRERLTFVRLRTDKPGADQDHVLHPDSDPRCQYLDGQLTLPLYQKDDWAGEKKPLRGGYLLAELTFDNKQPAPALDLVAVTTLMR